MHNAALRNPEADGNVVKVESLLPESHCTSQGASENPAAHRLCSLRENEARHVAYVLHAVQGDRHEAARILGISVRQVQRKIAALQEDDRLGTLFDDI